MFRWKASATKTWPDHRSRPPTSASLVRGLVVSVRDAGTATTSSGETAGLGSADGPATQTTVPAAGSASGELSSGDLLFTGADETRMALIGILTLLVGVSLYLGAARAVRSR